MAMEEPLYFNPSKKHKVDTNTACQRTQTDGIKDISTWFWVRISLREYSIFNKYVEKWMVYAKDIGNMEIYHVLSF